jgi:hypothetical protein
MRDGVPVSMTVSAQGFASAAGIRDIVLIALSSSSSLLD